MSESYERVLKAIRPICSEKNLEDLMFYLDTDERRDYISSLVENGQIKNQDELIRTVVEKYFILQQQEPNS
jgi:hypothetical protein